MCGRLNKSLYDTRDAAQNWEHAHMEFLESVGFKRGVVSPCIFYNKAREIRVVVHGDDFTVLGNTVELDWFRQQISTRFEVKFRGRLGPGRQDDKSIRVLNRVITWTNSGLLYEADQRHAELIVQQLRLSHHSKPVSTPSVKLASEDDRELSGEDATIYRALAARANYLSQDRADIGFAVKELCRYMSKPRQSDWDRMKRFRIYLIDKTRVVSKFQYQEAPNSLRVVVDTDHAGCLETRKSTSGGLVMLGEHCIKTLSLNQQVIAISSGEAEYYGMVKGASNALGISAMLKDAGLDFGIELETDASAATGIASRRGLGRVRHIELAYLWLQDQVARNKISIRKIRGEGNFSDSLTKHSSPDRIAQTVRFTNQEFVNGRREIMPNTSA